MKFNSNRVSNTIKNINQDGFPCNFCCRPKPYNSKSDIRKHYQSCHFGPRMIRKNFKLGFVYKNDVSYICVKCGKRLKSKNAVLIHINRYHSDCDENATNDDDSQILKVMKNKKKQAGFFCYFCDRTKPFLKSRDAIHHFGVCHFGPAMMRKNLKSGYIYRGPTQFVCIHCGENRKSKQAINQHMGQHKTNIVQECALQSDDSDDDDQAENCINMNETNPTEASEEINSSNIQASTTSTVQSHEPNHPSNTSIIDENLPNICVNESQEKFVQPDILKPIKPAIDETTLNIIGKLQSEIVELKNEIEAKEVQNGTIQRDIMEKNGQIEMLTNQRDTLSIRVIDLERKVRDDLVEMKHRMCLNADQIATLVKEKNECNQIRQLKDKEVQVALPVPPAQRFQMKHNTDVVDRYANEKHTGDVTCDQQDDTTAGSKMSNYKFSTPLKRLAMDFSPTKKGKRKPTRADMNLFFKQEKNIMKAFSHLKYSKINR